MHEQFNFLMRPGIVPRLRAIFVIILLILGSSMIIGVFQLKTLENYVDNLTVNSISTFVHTGQTERELKDFLALLQRVERASLPSQIDPLVAQVARGMEELREDARQLTGIGLSSDSAERMTETLDKIAATTARIFSSKRAIFRHTKNLTQLVAELNGSRMIIRNAIQNLAIEASQTGEISLRDSGDVPELQLEEIKQRFTNSLLSAHSIYALSLKLDAVIGTARGLQNVIGLPELANAEAELRLNMRAVADLLGKLPNSLERAELTKETHVMRVLLFSEFGLVSETAKLLKNRTILFERFLGQLTPIQMISGISSELTRVARSQIEESRQDLENLADRMTLVLGTAAGLSFAIIIAAVVFIVERQINRRMANLTKAVLAIADGERNYAVKVSGSDELGEMAKALEVFKVNAAELQRSNTELEKFAYAAAHDLRSPLRAIQDLTEWTLEDPENVFSEDGRRNMGFLQHRIGRLSRLLSDLLKYSRIGKEAEDIVEVSIKDIVAEISEMLDPENAFEIQFLGDIEHARTYATPLRQILLNLISNSIKHHDYPTGIITVATRQASDRLVCTVQDDGPGIDPKYHEKVFLLFQTLRPRDEVEGSGLGLAIISKLVEHYDGTIEMKSDPKRARGTRFVFDLPEKSSEIPSTRLAA